MTHPGSWKAPLSRSRFVALLVILFLLVLLSSPSQARLGMELPARLRLATQRPELTQDLMDPALLRQLQTLDDFVRQGRWSEAIPAYQHLTFTRGDELVPTDASGELLWPMRKVCQERLGSLPEKARTEAANLAENTAAKWFAEATRSRDDALLRRILEEAACSSVVPAAWNLLGDDAATQGQWAEAERCWRRARAVDPVRVQAKILLAQLEQGQSRQFADGFKHFAENNANVEGTLAGLKGSYVAILKQKAAQRRPQPEKGLGAQSDWGHIGTVSPLPRLELKSLVIFGRNLLCHDGKKVFAIHLDSVQTEEWFSLRDLMPPLQPEPTMTHLVAEKETLVLCVQSLSQTTLFGVEKRPRGNVLWRRDLPGRLWAPPLTSGNNILLGVQQGASCEVLALEAATGILGWKKPLPVTESRTEHENGCFQLAGHRLMVYHPGLGLGALETTAGRWCWLRRLRLVSPQEWQATDREVFVCAEGTECVWRLDLDDGQILWRSAAMSPQQLIGTNKDLMILSTEKDMRALDRATGRVVWRTAQPASASGRGCLLGHLLLWPTAEGVRILTQSDGELTLDPQWLKRIPAGDFLPIADRLLIVTPQGLHVHRWQP